MIELVKEGVMMLCFKCSKPIERSHPVSSGLHEECFLEWFQLKVSSPFIDIAAKNTSTGEEFSDNFISSFFHGKFKKYSAALGNKSYIQKVQEKDFPELPATEYLCNQIASQLGLIVPPFYLIRFEEKLETFVSENFMPKNQACNLIHIYHFLKSSQEFNCENLLKIIESKTGSMQDVRRFVEMTLFDALIGNHDRHGRNLALFESPKGFQLTPFYDNPSYLGTEIDMLLGAHHEPRGQIYTAHSKEPKMAEYVKEWERLGHIEIVDAFREKVRPEELKSLVDKSFISDKRKLALKKLINNRYLELIR